MSSAHEDWVTSRVKSWLDATRTAAIAGVVAYIKSENASARADGFDNPDFSDEDVEYLADQLEEIAKRALGVADAMTAAETPDDYIRRDFIYDCLSEADWTDLAQDYLNPENDHA